MTAPELDREYKAQHYEDQWIDRSWDIIGLPENGFCVDFGAADGVKLSNTWFLEKYHGYSGLLIDPDPRNEHDLLERPKCIFERAAVGPPGEVSFGMCEDPLLSGTQRSRIPSIKSFIRSRHKAIQAQEVIRVQSRPLTEILDQHEIPRVDFISIDVEGTEPEAWRTLDLKRWRPIVAIIELKTWGLPDRSQEIIRMMRADGYSLIERTFHNGIFRDKLTCDRQTLQALWHRATGLDQQ